MKKNHPIKKYLADYQAPPFHMEKVNLCIDIQPLHAIVTLNTTIKQKNKAHQNCWLDGKNIKILSIFINEKTLKKHEYQTHQNGLTLFNVPKKFTFKIVQEVDVFNNTSLEGLYESDALLCTQCEPDGFSRITHYIDRPDHLCAITTTIIAPKNEYPILLCNGEKTETKTLNNSRHQATFVDPFRKPCYLFAMVAGDLACIEDRYTTQQGKNVVLKIYRKNGKELKQLHYALDSLKRAMQFDEEVFGLSYDLSQYIIVAIDHFNSGAMENKGLNLFNTRYLLADQTIATDNDQKDIRAVVAHEYFHNWTGNRVTCRDWFQLSLKEGLTVLREQLFMDTQIDPVLNRIDQVNLMKNVQFEEDEGPLAHYVQPDSYIEVDNFYTSTVYEKGAEIIRMIKRWMGDSAFFKGIAHYLSIHDQSYATIEDLIHALSHAHQRSLWGFIFWYKQIGTPHVYLDSSYDTHTQTFTLRIEQKNWDKANQAPALWIPIQISLMDAQGRLLDLNTHHFHSIRRINAKQAVILLQQETASFTFIGIKNPPVLSYLQNFSAPVHAHYTHDESNRIARIVSDPDPYARFEQMQAYHLQKIHSHHLKKPDDTATDVLEQLIENLQTAPGQLATVLELPDFEQVRLYLGTSCVRSIYTSILGWRQQVARTLNDALLECYALNNHPENTPEQRKLLSELLKYLVWTKHHQGQEKCVLHYRQADNLTDQLSALSALILQEFNNKQPMPLVDDLLEDFYQQHSNEPLMVYRYFRLQASRLHQCIFSRLQSLCAHPKFNTKNPNCVYSLLGAWLNNPYAFDGLNTYEEHHQFIAKYIVKFDATNPSMASHLLAMAFSTHHTKQPANQRSVKTQLLWIATHSLSNQTYEQLTRIQSTLL